ncbi:family 14 glycosylhydrolase [Herbiconiux sp. P18]|uniref:family 14 glycosylhydrolase n=1 Tax=Herbiconiux liangxiaofengii TaxID=3342795 RepID=UPI0035B8CF68
MAPRLISRLGLALTAAALLAGSFTAVGVTTAPAPPALADSAPAPSPVRGAAATVNVMAPLWIEDWASDGPDWRAFTASLAVADAQGVDAVAVDVWWGKTEPARGTFDWAYYDKLFGAVTRAGLDLVPMMSFHQCGGNVDDACTTIPVPPWVWEPYEVCGIAGCLGGPVDDYFRSEYGNVNREAVAPWGVGVDRALADMRDFMNAFEDHYSAGATDYRGRIQEITIGTGPAGELRYPSYAHHDDAAAGSPAAYPNRGTFQSYTDSAVRDFADWSVARYGSVAGVAAAWGIPGLTYAAISPPTDHDRFITSGSYASLRYGKDFTRWYSESLLEHGHDVMVQAIDAFDGAFAAVPLGFKVPGVHWQTMASSPMRRVPEIAAGLVHTDQAYNSAATGNGYDPLMNLVHDLETVGDGTSTPTHPIVLHFTALEMPDGREWDGSDHAYSDAASLVSWVAGAAHRAGVTLKGENALAGNLASAGSPSTVGWSHIRDAFTGTPAPYSGLTVLRISDVSGPGAAGRGEFERFLRDFH